MKFLSSSRMVQSALGTPPENGADQLVRLAEGMPGQDWESGEFYVKRKAGTRLNRLALDAEPARALGEWSEIYTH